MAIGVIQIVIGGIVLIISLFTDINSAAQQSVKALWELTGVILICFGILSILITKIIKYLKLLYGSSDSIDYMLKEANFDTDIEEIKTTVKNIEGEIIKK